MNARVLLVGVGGLGSASALYLAAAGVGTLGMVDDDVVDRSDLERQVLHRTDRIGLGKVDSAEQSIAALNPRVQVLKYRTRLDAANVDEIIDGYDAIVDGADDFATRYVLNNASVRLRIPVVSAAICDCEGRISVFLPGAGPCYRCLYREPPPDALSPACCGAGVISALPGVMGTLQATEVIKLLTGVGKPLVGRILVYDAADATFTELRRERDPDCPVCAPSRRRDRVHGSREIGSPRPHARAADGVR